MGWKAEVSGSVPSKGKILQSVVAGTLGGQHNILAESRNLYYACEYSPQMVLLAAADEPS
jgi:hypothetical protein